MGKLAKALKKKSIVLLSDSVQSDRQLDEQIAISFLHSFLKSAQPLQFSHSFRSAVHSAHRHLAVSADEGHGSSLTAKVSAALAGRRWIDAQCILAERRIRKVQPKLGALQRWVRECDAASVSADQADPRAQEQVMATLEAILRTCKTLKAVDAQVVTKKNSPWSPSPDQYTPGPTLPLWGMSKTECGTHNNLALVLPSSSSASQLREQFKIVSNISGEDRQPANDYPAIIFSASPSAFPNSSPPSRPVSRLDVPNVEGAFLLADVLSPSDCQEILTSAQVCGFTPDAPKGSSSGLSILAHNFILLSDPDWLRKVFQRMLPHLPGNYNGGKVTGINRRMRVYRYLPNQVYRPHIDGAWPPSGTDDSGENYVYDASPSDAPEWSRYTLLFYLNDDFEGGETTFFTPSETGAGLQAYPVKPMQGAVLVFPHGCSEGSLLHEGSAVMPGGAKFVIRTDLLYEVDKGYGELGGGKKRTRDQADLP